MKKFISVLSSNFVFLCFGLALQLMMSYTVNAQGGPPPGVGGGMPVWAGQNPTTLDDSLVVNLDGRFKTDLKVMGTARLQSLLVQNDAQFNGNVAMNGITTEPLLTDDSQVLIRLPNGQVKTVELKDLIIGMYSKDCGDPQPIVNPVWSNGLNKIYTAYCGNVHVGINTVDPEYPLDVAGFIYGDRIKAGNRNSIDNAMINGFDLTNSRDLMQLGLHGVMPASASEIRFLVRHHGSVFIQCTDHNTAFEIHNGTGKAIIAYSNSGAKIMQLEDNGLLRTREIRLDAASWADYVFDAGYSLPKLKDVAKFIEINHHLPGVPNAKEMQANGINVAEMQTLQMQKIEELTLYMIEMDKKMDEMQAEIDGLKQENATLKNSIND